MGFQIVARGLSICCSQVLQRRPNSCARGLCCSVARGIFPAKGWPGVLCVGRQILYHWATREAPGCLLFILIEVFLIKTLFSVLSLNLFILCPGFKWGSEFLALNHRGQIFYQHNLPAQWLKVCVPLPWMVTESPSLGLMDSLDRHWVLLIKMKFCD